MLKFGLIMKLFIFSQNFAKKVSTGFVLGYDIGLDKLKNFCKDHFVSPGKLVNQVTLKSFIG
jgi:hypothetical protein